MEGIIQRIIVANNSYNAGEDHWIQFSQELRIIIEKVNGLPMSDREVFYSEINLLKKLSHDVIIEWSNQGRDAIQPGHENWTQLALILANIADFANNLDQSTKKVINAHVEPLITQLRSKNDNIRLANQVVCHATGWVLENPWLANDGNIYSYQVFQQRTDIIPIQKMNQLAEAIGLMYTRYPFLNYYAMGSFNKNGRHRQNPNGEPGQQEFPERFPEPEHEHEPEL